MLQKIFTKLVEVDGNDISAFANSQFKTYPVRLEVHVTGDIYYKTILGELPTRIPLDVLPIRLQKYITMQLQSLRGCRGFKIEVERDKVFCWNDKKSWGSKI